MRGPPGHVVRLDQQGLEKLGKEWSFLTVRELLVAIAPKIESNQPHAIW